MDIISFFLIPPLLVIAAIITDEYVKLVTKEIADVCESLCRTICNWSRQGGSMCLTALLRSI